MKKRGLNAASSLIQRAYARYRASQRAPVHRRDAESTPHPQALLLQGGGAWALAADQPLDHRALGRRHLVRGAPHSLICGAHVDVTQARERIAEAYRHTSRLLGPSRRRRDLGVLAARMAAPGCGVFPRGGSRLERITAEELEIAHPS